MAGLLTLVALLAGVGGVFVPWHQAVPSEMVLAIASKALDGSPIGVGLRSRSGSDSTSSGVKSTSEAHAHAPLAVTGNVARPAALVALLSWVETSLPLETTTKVAPHGRTIGLDVPDAAAGIALFAIGASGLRAIGRLVAWLPAVVAEPFGSLAVLSNVAEIAAFEAPLSRTWDSLLNTTEHLFVCIFFFLPQISITTQPQLLFCYVLLTCTPSSHNSPYC